MRSSPKCSERSLVFVSILLGLCSACSSPRVLATAKLGDSEMNLVDARGEITRDATALELRLTGWHNPSCRTIDDETAVEAVLRVTDPDAVVLGEPVRVDASAAPVQAVLAMGSMGRLCQSNCEDPQYAVSGTVTFTELSPTRICGSLDLTLTGDVPSAGNPDEAYVRNTSLSLRWEDFCAPLEIDHCD